MNLDVVVTDSAGNSLTDLTKQDFSLKLGGRPVAIDYFTRVERTAPHAPDLGIEPPAGILVENRKVPDVNVPGYFLVYVDTGHLTQMERARALKALRSFVSQLGTSDSARLVLFDQRSHELTAWTRSKEHLLSALRQMEASSGGSRLQTEIQALQRIDDSKRSEGDPWTRQSLARAYGEQERGQVLTMLHDLDAQISTLAVTGGKRVLLFISGGFGMQPGLAMMQYADPQAMLTAQEGQSMATRVEAMVRRANASDITCFTLDARGLMAGVSERSGDRPGHDPLVLSDAPLTSRAVSFQARQNSQRGMNLLANDTGGFALANTNDFATGLSRVYRDSSYYYTIGVDVSALPSGNYSEVVVYTRRPGVTVRSRRGFAARSVSDQGHDIAQAALMTNVEIRSIPVTLRVGAIVKQETLYDVPIAVTVPVSALTLLPEGAAAKAEAEIYIGAIDDNGLMSDIARREVSFAQARDCADGNCPFRVRLQARKGNLRVVVNVRDRATGRMGTAKTDVHVE